ncbi:hypothetical protein FOCC_FOCC015118 [Frankliniella occidentalis]|nr:hypothetical protein FOCC_FOCC015118 [Frankliniella occidentalis]
MYADSAGAAMVLSILYVLVVWVSLEVVLLFSSPLFLMQYYYSPYLSMYQRWFGEMTITRARTWRLEV